MQAETALEYPVSFAPSSWLASLLLKAKIMDSYDDTASVVSYDDTASVGSAETPRSSSPSQRYPGIVPDVCDSFAVSSCAMSTAFRGQGS